MFKQHLSRSVVAGKYGEGVESCTVFQCSIANKIYVAQWRRISKERNVFSRQLFFVIGDGWRVQFLQDVQC